MAFFCERSGVRIVAPGIAKSAGGDVAEYDHASEVCDAAERAAGLKLIELAQAENEASPSPEALKAAKAAAEDEITKPRAEKARNK